MLAKVYRNGLLMPDMTLPVTIPLPSERRLEQVVTVESSEYTIGNADLRVSFNGRTSASQADYLLHREPFLFSLIMNFPD